MVDSKKKPRTFWFADGEYERLRAKARKEFSGKGSLEKYLREVADYPTIILKIKDSTKLQIEITSIK